MKFIIIFIFFSFFSLAQALEVKDILIRGNKKTKDYVIQNELGLRGKTKISKSELKAGIQRLKNTSLFSKVLVKKKQNKIIIEVEERWTTIPILKFSSGGGVGQLTIGVFDPNVAGHFVEAGGQYKKLDETNSGVVWFKNPRLFGKRYKLDLQFWKESRLRTKYDQFTDAPIAIDGFLHNRDKAYLAFAKEISDDLEVELSYEYNNDNFSDKLIPEEVSEVESLPLSSKVHFIGTGLNYGRANLNSFLIDGSILSSDLRYGLAQTEGIDDFYNLDLTWNYYKSIGQHTLATRFSIGGTDTNVLQYWNYFGGLEHIRGFADNRFSGRYYWLLNAEYRIPLILTKNWILQSSSFVDFVNTQEQFKRLTNLSGASAGLGLRVILPRIYRFVIRVDFAKPILLDDDNALSFGVQQFF